jgi:hypothetical protein
MKNLFNFEEFKKNLDLSYQHTKSIIIKSIEIHEKTYGDLPIPFKKCFINNSYKTRFEIEKVVKYYANLNRVCNEFNIENVSDFLIEDNIVNKLDNLLNFSDEENLMDTISEDKIVKESISKEQEHFINNLYNSELYKIFMKSLTIKEYEYYYEPLTNNFKESFIFKSYINKFKIPDNLLNYINIPDGFEDFFDLKLLVQLVSASFSSSCNFEINNNGKLDLIIEVESYQTFILEYENPITFKQYLESYVKPNYSKNDYENLIMKQITPLDLILETGHNYEIIYTVKKVLSELWTFQVLRLFEIYSEEQINLFCLIKSEPQEAMAISNKQVLLFEVFKNHFPNKFASAVELVNTDKVLDL